MSSAWVLPWCLVLIGAGCAVTPQRHQIAAQVHAESDISANFEQARLRMRALVQPMSGVIVASADEILAHTSDRTARRQALLWKIEGVPALREALFQPDPMTAVADTWVLTFQMIDYFETGPGGQALGEARPIAVTTSQQLEAAVARVAASLTISGNVADARAYARKWAADHPMRQSIAGRESALTLVTDREWPSSFSTTAAIGDLMVTVDDLNRRLEVYSAQLLDQSRWQAELFLMDSAQAHHLDTALPLAQQLVDALDRMGPAAERAVPTLEQALPLGERAVTAAGRAGEALDRTSVAVERSLAFVERSPALIAAERAAAVKALSAELTRTLAFLHGERQAALKQLDAERIAVLRELTDLAVQEGKLLTDEIDGVAVRAVDRAFLRAAQLCAAVFGAIILLMILARRMFFGPRYSGDEPQSPHALGPSRR